ncbi:OmpA family protein, partial [Bacteroidota bacterium]
IRIESRNLPSKPSNTRKDDGREENRRVEITSNFSEILEPIVTLDTTYFVSPELIRFKEPARVKFGEAYWNLELKQNGEVIKEFNGEGTADYDLDWNIADEMAEPKNNSPIFYEIVVNDKEIQKTIVAKDTIPVEVIHLKERELSISEKILHEKYSLILFDFGSSDIRDGNQKIIDELNTKINSYSNINIIGYTDRSGNNKFNVRLSQKRAESAAKKIIAGNIIVEGKGESKLLYDNNLPEGRFYCRTVDIIIETATDKGRVVYNGY